MNSAISITLVRNKNEKYDATFIYFMKSTCTSVNTIQGHTTATILLYATPLSQFINSPSRTDLFLSVLQKIFCETVLHWGAGLAACKPRSAVCTLQILETPAHTQFCIIAWTTERKETDRLDRFSGRLWRDWCRNFKRPSNKETGMSNSQPYSWNLKGSDRQCKVVELSMQCCGKIISDSFETYQTF